MGIFIKIQNEYRKNKMLFFLKLCINIIASYFAFRVMFVSVSALMSKGALPDNMDLLLFIMLFFLGLSNVIELVEMIVHKKKECFTLLIVTTIVLFGVSIFVLLV